jgi:hypothetical protein
MENYELCRDIFSKGASSWSFRSPPLLSALYESIAASFSQPMNQDILQGAVSHFSQDLSANDVFPSKIRDYILNVKHPFQVSYTFITPSGRTVRVCLWSPQTIDTSYIETIYAWFSFLDPLVPNPCSQELVIYLYMTPCTKKMNGDPFLDSYHVNSGASYSCQPSNEIYIFRQEEWLKVLIHECFHALGMDSAWYTHHDGITKKLQRLFPQIKTTNMSIYESYTEFWAEILVILVQVFMITRESTYTKVKPLVLQCIYYEAKWSLIQCTKILAFYHLTYQELLSGKPFPDTPTPIFSYYVLKCVLMFHASDFISWCCRQSSNTGASSWCFIDLFNPAHASSTISKNLNSLVDFILEHGKTEPLLKEIRMVQDYQEKRGIGNVLRMSLWGGEA